MQKQFRYILIFLIGGMQAFSAFSQAIQTIRSPENQYSGTFRLNPKSDGVKGTPYLFEIPPMGNISLNNGNVHDQVPFNILLETNTVYIQTGGEDSEPLALKNWQWIKTMGEDERLFKMEFVSGKSQLVEILFENENGKYVALHSKTLVQPSGVRDGYTGPQYDTYKHDIKYLFIKGMQSSELKTNSSGMKDLAGEKYNELKNFIKTEKLKPENPTDLRKILIFLLD
ncbi:hypothetical protein [Aquiflexum lacus]|uniref:hypothetical protein n=1 Tax=Aquiflexum lacus TaxID=2483805 RepID=UPI001E431805|nr:hypothetical protein [Aquiflexum lacus]